MNILRSSNYGNLITNQQSPSLTYLEQQKSFKHVRVYYTLDMNDLD